MRELPKSEIVESCSVAGPGFVNVVLSKKWMAKVFFKLLLYYLSIHLYKMLGT